MLNHKTLDHILILVNVMGTLSKQFGNVKNIKGLYPIHLNIEYVAALTNTFQLSQTHKSFPKNLHTTLFHLITSRPGQITAFSVYLLSTYQNFSHYFYILVHVSKLWDRVY